MKKFNFFNFMEKWKKNGKKMEKIEMKTLKIKTIKAKLLAWYEVEFKKI